MKNKYLRFAQNWIDMPSNKKTIDASVAKLKGFLRGMNCDVLQEPDQLELLNAMGGRLFVATNAPDADHYHTVIIGKGILFDSGGFCAKDYYSEIYDMHTDMAGAAVCAAAFRQAIDAGTSRKYLLLLPLAENSITTSSKLYPGGVYSSAKGRVPSVEVIDTDAEGRLVLADALAYLTVRGVSADRIITAGTLGYDGMGTHRSAFYATSDKLAKDVYKAADSAGERWWRLPIAYELLDYLKSHAADLLNLPLPSNDPHADNLIIATFLAEFVPDNCAWVHFNLGGPVLDSRRKATGFGLATLVNLLEGVK